MEGYPVRPIPRAARQFAPRWNDVRNPFTLTKQGATLKPDYDYTRLGLLFPRNDADEKVYISDQLGHDWAGSDGSEQQFRPHIHYLQESASLPVFKVDYRFYNNGGSVPSFTTLSTADGDGVVFTYTSGAILQIMLFPVITVSGLGSSAWYDMVLYRDDDVVAGDVLGKGFDWHQLFDSLGSRGEFEK